MTYIKICDDCLAAKNGPGAPAQFAQRMSVLLTCEHGCSMPDRTVSRYSPSPVDDNEIVAACASHPHHSAEDGTVTHKVFDRAFTQGLSVTRLHVKKMEEVMALCMKIDVDKREKNPEANAKLHSMGAVTLTAQKVREIKFPDCNSFAFRVYDTGLKKNRAHADIIGSKHFGEFEELPKNIQPLRNHVQLLLARTIDFVPSKPA